jgi:predicted membrane protein (TIGR00267 family)
MKAFRWLVGRKYRLDLVAGFCDGILTALTLAAGKILDSHASMSAGLPLRVATAAAISGAFIVFVAHYAELRGELLEAEKQLNLTTHGRLAKSRLGRAVLFESMIGASVASLCGFWGAWIPLLIAVLVPAAPWLGMVVALAALAVLGVFLAITVHGRPFRWAGSLVLSGGILAYLGMYLRLI